MGKLKFEYRMELKLSSPVTDHYFALRCVPGDSLRQTVTLTQCDVSPADYISEAEDGFGNLKISGCCREPHDFFACRIRGTARTSGMLLQKGPLHPMYRYPSKYTGFESEVRDFAESVQEECRRNAAGTDME